MFFEAILLQYFNKVQYARSEEKRNEQKVIPKQQALAKQGESEEEYIYVSIYILYPFNH